jgi:hypothetical protein
LFDQKRAFLHRIESGLLVYDLTGFRAESGSSLPLL